MFRILISKDFRRAWRNPLPWLIYIVIPVGAAALIGLAFGGRSEQEIVGRIRFAIVDQDQSPMMDLLRGAMNHREVAEYLDPIFLDREDALRQIRNNKISAALIIPEDFSLRYLTGQQPLTLELIKNPAQSWHPAILEEGVKVLVTGLNALRQTLGAELANWETVFDGKMDHREVADLIVQAGDRLETVGKYLDPPLIGQARRQAPVAAKSGPEFNLFVFLLVGLTAMFLLFIAGNTVSDLHREMRRGTLARFHTLHHSLFSFLAAKVFFAWLLLLISCLIALGVGGVMFQMAWRRPDAVLALAAAYCFFAAGLMSLLVALVQNEQRADTVNYIAAIVLGLAGGCAFPAQQLPRFIREHVSPLLPSYWITDTIRQLEFWNISAPWLWKCLAMAALGGLGMAAAAFIFRKRIEQGCKP